MYLHNGFEIERIYLIAAFQGKGLGKKLLTKVLNMGKEMGYKKVWLGVWENNFKAIRFYKKYGFKKFGQHNFFVGKRFTKLIICWKWIFKQNLKKVKAYQVYYHQTPSQNHLNLLSFQILFFRYC